MSENSPTRADAKRARADAKAARTQARRAKKAASATQTAARQARKAARAERARTWWSWARRNLEGRWGTAFLVVLAASLFAIAWPTLHLTHDVHPALQPVVAGFAALPILLVRLNPVLGWSISAAAALVIPIGFGGTTGHTVGEALPWQVVHIIVLLALWVAVCAQAPALRVVEVSLGTVALFAVFAPGRDRVGWVVALGGILVVALLLRKLWSSRVLLARQEAANELERSHSAALEERARIARDLHDVVAHHMSLIVVQSQTAPYRVHGLSEEARAEFDSIAVSAREALNEVRVMLGVLRSDEAAPEHEPQPGVGQLQALVDGSVRAGARVSLESTGALEEVGMAVGVVLYRIVQESLANAARHAPGAPVRVRVEAGAERLVVEIVNGPASGAAPPERSGGSGIRGMRERARAVRGTLTAQPTDDGGFVVRAELPITAGHAIDAAGGA